MNEASKIRLLEEDRAIKVKEILGKILHCSVCLEANDDNTMSDSVATIEIDGICVRILVLELKREIGATATRLPKRP
jgi:hypothetical protein